MTVKRRNGDGQGVSRFRVGAWSTAVLLLLLPLIAMQFTDEVVWELSDFAIFGALLAGIGITLEVVVSKIINTAYRFAVGMALAAAFIEIWVNGAVGIIGSENNLANLMYYGALAVGFIAAFIARFRPHGMARAMIMTAAIHALIAVIALISGLGDPVEILILNGFFIALFVGSAWLFRRAARDHG